MNRATGRVGAHGGMKRYGASKSRSTLLDTTVEGALVFLRGCWGVVMMVNVEFLRDPAFL